MGPKQFKYTSSACFVIGFLIPFLASSYIGMSFSAMPLVTVATIGLWIIGLLLRYYAYIGAAKPPATLSFRMRLGNFISSEPSLFLTLGIVFGYLYLSFRREKRGTSCRAVSSYDYYVYYGPSH